MRWKGSARTQKGKTRDRQRAGETHWRCLKELNWKTSEKQKGGERPKEREEEVKGEMHWGWKVPVESQAQALGWGTRKCKIREGGDQRGMGWG